MKKDNKQRLFEVMGKLDKTFKPKLNEMVNNNDPFDAFKADWNYPMRKENERFMRWYNHDESTFYQSEDYERTTLTHVLDVPKTEFNENDLELLKREYMGSSHGVEGNPGGMTDRGWVSDPEDMGDFYRITIERSFILDV